MFDRFAAMCLGCWWIQKVTDDVWIGMEQNITDTADNEWRKRLGAYVRLMGQHFL